MNQRNLFLSLCSCKILLEGFSELKWRQLFLSLGSLASWHWPFLTLKDQSQAEKRLQAFLHIYLFHIKVRGPTLILQARSLVQPYSYQHLRFLSCTYPEASQCQTLLCSFWVFHIFFALFTYSEVFSGKDQQFIYFTSLLTCLAILLSALSCFCRSQSTYQLTYF